MNTATFEYRDQAELERKLVVAVETLGYTVFKRQIPWERCVEVGKRLGLRPNVLSERLKAYGESLLAQRGPRGRIRFIQVTPDLQSFLTR